jgi:hypothetical protein
MAIYVVDYVDAYLIDRRQQLRALYWLAYPIKLALLIGMRAFLTQR